jgi:hypothetical protein
MSDIKRMREFNKEWFSERDFDCEGNREIFMMLVNLISDLGEYLVKLETARSWLLDVERHPPSRLIKEKDISQFAEAISFLEALTNRIGNIKGTVNKPFYGGTEQLLEHYAKPWKPTYRELKWVYDKDWLAKIKGEVK